MNFDLTDRRGYSSSRRAANLGEKIRRYFQKRWFRSQRICSAAVASLKKYKTKENRKKASPLFFWNPSLFFLIDSIDQTSKKNSMYTYTYI